MYSYNNITCTTVKIKSKNEISPMLTSSLCGEPDFIVYYVSVLLLSTYSQLKWMISK